MPGPDIALCVRMHVCEATVPEEPYILFICDWLRIEKVMVDLRVGAEIQEMVRDGMNTGGHRVGWRIHGVTLGEFIKVSHGCVVKGS